MVNLSYVTHTFMWGAPNKQVASTSTSVVGLGTDASIGVEGLLLGCKNYRTT
jgi:nucleoside-specific outer membrane channel protein Tsx